MKKIFVTIFLACSAILMSGLHSCLALDTEPQKHVCYRVDKPITLDAKFDEAIWKKLPAMKDWTVTVDAKNLYSRPAYPTIAWACWDEINLYVAFECIDIDIFAKKIEKDDSVWEDDAFEIYIDPDGDGKDYVEIEVNPLNNVLDLLIPAPWKIPWQEAGVFDVEGLRTVTRIYGTLNYKYDEDEKWVGEISIPFSALAETICETKPVKINLPPNDGDTWRIQLYRSDRGKKLSPRSESIWTAWSPTKRTHATEEFGFITFTKKNP